MISNLIAPNKPDCAGMAAELGRLDGILTTTSSRLNENIAVTGNADLRQSIDQTLADINFGASLVEAGQSTLLAANSAWLRGTPSNASSFLGGSGNAMRGNLLSSGALNGLRIVGTSASVLGAGLEANAAIVAFSNGETNRKKGHVVPCYLHRDQG